MHQTDHCTLISVPDSRAGKLVATPPRCAPSCPRRAGAGADWWRPARRAAVPHTRLRNAFPSPKRAAKARQQHTPHHLAPCCTARARDAPPPSCPTASVPDTRAPRPRDPTPPTQSQGKVGQEAGAARAVLRARSAAPRPPVPTAGGRVGGSTAPLHAPWGSL